MKKVAILIPTHKPKEYLERCLESIEHQTLDKTRFCVYIALNGLKEPYESYILSLLKKYSFMCRYSYIKTPSVSNARNMLIDISMEEYIAFIDDDDCISKNYLQSLLDLSTESLVGISSVYAFEKDIDNLQNHYVNVALPKNHTT